MMACQNLAVPAEVMQHVVNVESSRNPFAIGVVGGQLVRQPQNLGEAVATVRMLESKGYNYSLGAAQVNRANLGKFGLDSYEKAFEYCPSIVAGSRILAQCYASASNDWGKAFSCYYSGNFTTGYEQGYVQKIYDSMTRQALASGAPTAIPIPLVRNPIRVVGVGKGVTGMTADSPAYRVAMRSALDAAASSTVTPAIAAAAGMLPSGRAATIGDLPVFDVNEQFAQNTNAQAAPGRIPIDASTAAVMAQVGQQLPQTPSQPQAGRIATDPATAAAMAQVGVSAASQFGNAAAAPGATNNDVFVPQVRGPNDSVPASATGPSQAAPRGPDQTDLRVGARDDAFVF
jgi:type IV secretion system protein VirB1